METKKEEVVADVELLEPLYMTVKEIAAVKEKRIAKANKNK